MPSYERIGKMQYSTHVTRLTFLHGENETGTRHKICISHHSLHFIFFKWCKTLGRLLGLEQQGYPSPGGPRQVQCNTCRIAKTMRSTVLTIFSLVKENENKREKNITNSQHLAWGDQGHHVVPATWLYLMRV